ncbi:hypothetical protein PPERSA_12588 [Pseudocohnilembus persalinus]|uniref:Uncharacterized protein n=1 Tax=Pseudocohnilembus persalinus TaxID=266149 RepID=A0A0V0QCI1_PSEPJ|nr:hypothetical protein PPERSA_12588 [Pseudocohnilembus persalinus]|eukprot:KRW99912.1 hypothetical protein PPERSA_12588 [Pseudocohnilembus persalinus]
MKLEKVNKALSEWNYPSQSCSKIPPRDFLVMNKMAIKDKIINPKGQSEYRKSHEVRQLLKEGKKYSQIKLPENQFRYGVPNKPSTPINRIIQQEYANESEKQYLQEYEQKMLKIQQEKREKHWSLPQKAN